MKEQRITPEHITTLKHGEIFVFGSNLLGLHGAGAAKLAYDKGWAQYNKGIGMYFSSNYLSGSFAIPTKGVFIETLPLEQIEYFVKYFRYVIEGFPQLKFLVTEIGCGLAGYTPEQIAPFFKQTIHVENVYLPKRFLEVLNKQENGNRS
jgi:hypothetical protein